MDMTRFLEAVPNCCTFFPGTELAHALVIFHMMSDMHVYIPYCMLGDMHGHDTFS